MEESLDQQISYNEWQKISIQREAKLLCQKFGYEFSQSKLDENLEIYKDEIEGVCEFCCLYLYTREQKNQTDFWYSLNDWLLETKLTPYPPCKLGSDVLLYLYTQIANEVGWNQELVHCYNVGMKYTLPF